MFAKHGPKQVPKNVRIGLLTLALAGAAAVPAQAQETAPAAEARPAAREFLPALEEGESARRAGNFTASVAAWLAADEYVRGWEDAARSAPRTLLEGAGALLINDKMRSYEGKDYERVALATRLALNHLALNNWPDARTEVRKMHEREAIIAELRALEVDELKAQAESNNIRTRTADLKGYPVDTLDSPAVSGLRNSYQNAFGHYLAGFVYEQAGDTSLAAAGYRQAIELRPGRDMLQEALAGLDERIRQPSPQATDTLIVIEAGQVPGLMSTTVPLPIPTHNGLVLVPASFPSLPAAAPNPLPATIRVDGAEVAVEALTSYDDMARRALKDELPGIIVRGSLRSLAKGLVTAEAQKRSGLLGSLIANVIAIASEQADDRMWRSLPSHVGIARLRLAPGRHTLNLGGASGEVEVGGAYSLLATRQDGNSLFVSAATTPAVPEPVRVVASQAPLAGAAETPPAAAKSATKAGSGKGKSKGKAQ